VKLILHIGTHKTGTTAIQRLLKDNGPALARHGIHYATADLNANVIANAIALGDEDAARAFFDREIVAADAAGAHTVVVSAENFYSMATIGAALSGRLPDDAAAQEPGLVRRLQNLLPDAVSETSVVCYFRRPDLFAESLYNQRVKYETFHDEFEPYLRTVEPMFDYHRNAAVWAAVFGPENCTFTTYESVSGDIRWAFLREVLGVSDPTGFVEEPTRDNERISRDVLEFKRELNKVTPEADQRRAYKLACLLEKRVGLLASEPRHYQEFMSRERRVAFLEALSADLAAVQSTLGMAAFPPLPDEDASTAGPPYPGLSADRRAQLLRQYKQLNARLALRDKLSAGLRVARRRRPAKVPTRVQD
jgi:hypothetical protein